MPGFATKAFVGPVGMAIYKQHRHQRAKGKRREKRARKEERKAERRDVRHLKKDRADLMKYNERIAGSEAGANKRLEKVLGKYGGEKFLQQSNLTRNQRGLLGTLSNASKQGLHGMRTPEDVYDIRNEAPYQQAGSVLQDMLSNNPQAFDAYKGEALKEFEQDILPSIANKYASQGAGGLSSSGYQNELRTAGTDLTSRLKALRAGIQQKALPQALAHAQAPLAGEQSQISNLLAQNQQAQRGSQIALGVNPFTTQYRAPSFSPGIISGGPAPVPRSPGMSPEPLRPTSPSFLQQLGSSFGQPAAQGAGQALGSQLGTALAGAFL